MPKVKSQRQQGKFWPQVRAMIWEKAQDLYQQDEEEACLTIFRA